MKRQERRNHKVETAVFSLVVFLSFLILGVAVTLLITIPKSASLASNEPPIAPSTFAPVIDEIVTAKSGRPVSNLPMPKLHDPLRPETELKRITNCIGVAVSSGEGGAEIQLQSLRDIYTGSEFQTRLKRCLKRGHELENFANFLPESEWSNLPIDTQMRLSNFVAQANQNYENLQRVERELKKIKQKDSSHFEESMKNFTTSSVIFDHEQNLKIARSPNIEAIEISGKNETMIKFVSSPIFESIRDNTVRELILQRVSITERDSFRAFKHFVTRQLNSLKVLKCYKCDFVPHSSWKVAPLDWGKSNFLFRLETVEFYSTNLNSESKKYIEEKLNRNATFHISCY